jgi:hypothetical protein
MLNWREENGKHLGFDDDTLMYIIDYDTAEGWRWVDVFEGWGACDYADAEDAKAGAEDDYAKYPKDLTEDGEPFPTLEELDEILGDILCEERREAQLCK